MEEVRVEGELLGGIQRLRRELNEAMKDLRQEEARRRDPRERLQDARTELMTVYEKLAGILAKQEQCGCGCCTELAHMRADLQGRFGSLQRNLADDLPEKNLNSPSDTASLEDDSSEFGVGGPQCG